jgi:Domain of unknown function (DUF4266)
VTLQVAAQEWAMNLLRRATRVVVPVTAALALAACSNLGVPPWERDLLAKPGMQLSTSPVIDALDDHIHFSKEAATGGRSFGGGGCGCN